MGCDLFPFTVLPRYDCTLCHFWQYIPSIVHPVFPHNGEMLPSKDITYIARTNFRNEDTLFGIKQPDRLSHMYIIGKTGTGKTTLLETLIRQDIARGRGVALLDPHGDLVEKIAESIPKHRKQDLIYLNAPDPNQPYGYNPIRSVVAEKRPLAAAGILDVFKKQWDDSWGVRMEHILRNALLALLDLKDVSFVDITRLLNDKEFRKEAMNNVTNSRVRDFWLKEYNKYSYRLRADAIAPIQNKVGAFLANPILARILTKSPKPISLRHVMDSQKILLVNLSKGKLGEDTSNLLGGLLMSTIGLAAYSRADVPEIERKDFYLYADEFQNFTTLSIANMLSELRKFHLGMVLSNQYLHQLSSDVREAVLGNAGTFITFRIGPKDASFLSKEFDPVFETTHLLNLKNFHIFLKLLIDGAPSKPFSAETITYDDLCNYSPPKPRYTIYSDRSVKGRLY